MTSFTTTAPLMSLVFVTSLSVGCVVASPVESDGWEGNDEELASDDEALQAAPGDPSAARPSTCLCACDSDGAAYVVKNNTPLGSCVDVCQMFFASHPGLCGGPGTGFPIAK